jgi:OTU domain-containing protein 3
VCSSSHAGRTRTTRSSKPRLVLSDPNESSAQLDNQLRSLGLYAANTLGDGNCLFRALSDQLYGSPSKHAQLRQDICDFIVKHKSRYEPFVEDERGLDVHIRCMRENGTYGGHLELSSFAHMVKRNVKVIQPGLVYVIEWDAGLDEQERQRALRQLEAEEHDDTISKGTIYVA